MLAGFLLGIVHDRRLLRESQVNLAIRWFAGFGLNDRLPDHSSLTRIRQRWGADRFRRIFERTVRACMGAGIAKGEIVHVDASPIRADVSWESMVERHLDEVADAHDNAGRKDGEDVDGGPDGSSRTEGVGLSRKPSGRAKRISRTDPEASLATSGRKRRMEPSYKQHGAVDDVCGVILDVEVTTGKVNEGQVVLDRLDAVAATTGAAIDIVTADAGYAYAKVFAGLEDREIDAVIPAKAEQRPGKTIPTRRFRFDARHNLAHYPRGKTLRPKGKPHRGFQYFHARAKDCAKCPLRARCVSPSRHARVVVFNVDHPALLRARRRRLQWGEREDRLYARHRWRAEGFHGEAKTWHGLARAVRRGLDNIRIQAFLTAAAVNLKRLATALGVPFLILACLVLAALRKPWMAQGEPLAKSTAVGACAA